MLCCVVCKFISGITIERFLGSVGCFVGLGDVDMSLIGISTEFAEGLILYRTRHFDKRVLNSNRRSQDFLGPVSSFF